MAARKAGRVPVTGIETMEHDMNATGAAGVRKIRPLLGRLCAVVGLGLAMAGTGAGAEDGAAAPSGGYELVHLGGPVEHAVFDGRLVHDGDMLLGTPENSDHSIVSGSGPAGSAWPRRRDAAYVDPTHGSIHGQYVSLWPGGVIPYEIDRATLTPRAVDAIEEAIAYINRRCVLQWVPRTAGDSFLTFTTTSNADQWESTMGSPVLGRATLGFQSNATVWIKPGIRDGLLRSVIHHEMGHAMGLLHEHLRADAPRYLVGNLPQVYGLSSVDTVRLSAG